MFDRWGEKLFETDQWVTGSDHSIGWDGTYKGEIVNNGVYAYEVKATLFNSKQVVKKGSITVIR